MEAAATAFRRAPRAQQARCGLIRRTRGTLWRPHEHGARSPALLAYGLRSEHARVRERHGRRKAGGLWTDDETTALVCELSSRRPPSWRTRACGAVPSCACAARCWSERAVAPMAAPAHGAAEQFVGLGGEAARAAAAAAATLTRGRGRRAARQGHGHAPQDATRATMARHRRDASATPIWRAPLPARARGGGARRSRLGGGGAGCWRGQDDEQPRAPAPEEGGAQVGRKAKSNAEASAQAGRCEFRGRGRRRPRPGRKAAGLGLG